MKGRFFLKFLIAFSFFVQAVMAIEKVGYFLSTRTTSSTDLNQTTPYALEWSTENYDPNYFDHSVSSFSHEVYIKQNGNYAVTLTIPTETTANSRESIRVEIYVNGVPVEHTRAESGYLRNADNHNESSVNFSAILPSLFIDDKVEVFVSKGGDVGTVTTPGARLYLEFVDGAKDVFFAKSSESVSSTNLNLSSEAALKWSSVLKTSAFTHNNSSNNHNVTFSQAGDYFVNFNLPMKAADCSSGRRYSVQGILKINGSPISGGAASQGYIRCLSTTDLHEASSIHWFGVLHGVNANDTLTVDVVGETTYRDASYIVEVPVSRKGALYIEKVDTATKYASFLGTTITSGSDWNSASGGDVLWSNQQALDGTIYSHSTSTNAEQITINQDGDYLVTFNAQYSSNANRNSPVIRIKVNGITKPGSECNSGYIRNADGHNESSCTVSYMLDGLKSGDVIKITAGQGAASGTTTLTGNARLTIVQKDNTAYNFTVETIPNKIMHLDASKFTSLLDSNNRNANDLSFDGSVQTWSDTSNSAAAHDGTQTNASFRPTFDAVNKRLTFDGNDRFNVANHADLNLATLTEKTIVAVFRTGNDVTSNQIIYEEGGTIRGMNVYIGGGNLYIAMWNLRDDGDGYQAFTYASTPIQANTNYYTSLVLDYSNYSGGAGPDGQLRGHINGVEFASLGTTTSRLYPHSGAIAVGGMENDTYFHTGPVSGDGNYFIGDIFELVIYNSAISNSIAEDYYTYLTNKWPDPYPVKNLSLDSQFISSSTTSPNASWTASITPDVDHYEMAIGTTSGGNDTQDWTDVGNVITAQATGLTLSECTDYYASIKTVDAEAKESTVVSSDWFRYDGTNPGDPSSLVISGSSSSTISKVLSWTPSSDNCGFSHYEIAVGSSAGANDVKDWTNVGNVATYQFTGLVLSDATNYYFSIRAHDLAGNISNAVNSASWQVDTCVASDVTNPTDPSGLSLVGNASSTASPILNWSASTDSCGLSHYEVAAGTSAGASDIVTWTNVGNVLNHKFSSISPALLTNTNYYLSVRAVDLAANNSNDIASASWQLPSPGGVSTTGMEMWLDSDDISTLFQNNGCSTAVSSGGQSVGCWADKSGNGRNATTATNLPTYQTNQFNGKPVIRFDGTNDLLDFTALTNIRTVIMVNKSNGSNFQPILGHSSSQHFYTNDNTLLGTAASSFLKSGSWKVNQVDVADPENYNQTNQYAIVSVITSGNVSADHIASDQKTAGRFFGGDVVELIIFSRALSSNELEDIEAYLNDKWFSAAPSAVTNVTLSSAYTNSAVQTPQINWSHSVSPDVDHYEVSIGTTAGDTSTVPWTNVGYVNNKTFLGTSLSECSDYFANIKAVDSSSYESDVKSSTAFRFDGTVPTMPLSLTLSGSASVTTSKVLSWSTATDNCNLAGYDIAIGSTSGGNDVVNWVSIGNVNTYQFTGIAPNLVGATNYYLSLRARDGAGNISSVASSSAWQVDSCVSSDVTNPTDPSSLSLSGTADLNNSPTMSWTASSDACAFSHYEVSLSTTPGGTNVISWTDVGNVTSKKFSSIGSDLSYGTNYYMNVRAKDLAGNASNIVTSSAFQLTTPGNVSATGLSMWVDLKETTKIFSDDNCSVSQTTNNGLVGCVKDKSGNNNHIKSSLSSEKPILRTSSFLGQPSLYFDGGANEYLKFTTKLTDVRTVFWVLKQDNSNAGNNPFLLGDPDGTTYDFHGGAVNIFDSGNAAASVTGGTFKINTSAVDGTTTARPSTESVLSLVTTGNTTAGAFSRDRTTCCGQRTWGGYFAELIIFNRVLSGTEVQDIENYLTTKWGISASSTTWTGATNTDWATASNWSNGVPNNTIDCVIPDVANDPIVTAGTVACKNTDISGNLTLQNGSSSILEVFANLNVTGNLIVNDNILRFKDNGSASPNISVNLNSQNIGNVEFAKTSNNILQFNGSATASSFNIAGGNNFIFKMKTGSTLSLSSGLTQASGTFQMEAGTTIEVAPSNSINITGGQFQILGVADALDQEVTNKGKITTVGGTGNFGFTISAGNLTMRGFLIDRIDVNGINISGTANLVQMDGGQFTNIIQDFVTPVKVIQLNTSTVITESILTNVGFNWAGANASVSGLPAITDNYYLVYAPNCGGSSIFFDQWFGDFFPGNTLNPEDKIYDQDDGTTCQVSMDISASPVTMKKFTATPYDAKVLLYWETIEERDHLGFNVYRSDDFGVTYKKINTEVVRNFITSTTFQGSYRFVDSGLTNGNIYFYMLEDLGTDNSTMFHGPSIAIPLSGLGSVPSAGAGDNDAPANQTVVSNLGVGVDLLSKTGRSFRIRINPSALVVANSSLNASYKDVDILGYSRQISEGLPQLLERTILVPVEGNFETVTVSEKTNTSSDQTASLSGSPVVPAPNWTLDGSNQMVASFSINSSFYSASNTNPATFYTVSNTLKKIGTQYYVEIFVYPLMYNPVTNALTKLDSLILDIGLDGDIWKYPSLQDEHKISPATIEGSLRIKYTKAGMYKVTYDELATLNYDGFYNGLDLDDLRLYYHGKAYPIEIVSGDSLFNSGDEIIFYAPFDKALEDDFDEVVLTPFDLISEDDDDEWDSTFRITAINNPDHNNQVGTITNYFKTLTYEQDNTVLFDLPIGRDVDRFYWKRIYTLAGASPNSNSELSFTASLTDFTLNTTNDEVHVGVYVRGVPVSSDNPLHHLALNINGVQVDTVQFDVQMPTYIEFKVPSFRFVSGNNTIKLVALGDLVSAGDYDLLDINKVTVSYPSETNAVSGKLVLEDLEPDMQIEAYGFSSSNIKVYDISNPRETVVYSNTVIDSFDGGSTYAVLFDNYEGTLGESGKHYEILETSSYLSPSSIKLSYGRNNLLKDSDNSYDLVMIGFTELLNASEALVSHREAQGLSVLTVDIEQIYEEFSYGRVSSQAIKDFILYTQTNWTSSPKYVFLLGDATYDPRNALGFTSETRLLPMPLEQGLNLDFGAMSWLSTLDGEAAPTLRMGWLPTSDPVKVKSYVDKVIDYENGVRAPLAAKKSVFIAGEDTKNERFVEKVTSLKNLHDNLDLSYTSEVLDRNVLGSDAATKAEINNQFDNSPLLMTYYGHGAEDLWGSNDIFNTDDANDLTNTTLPIVASFNCLNAYFYDADTTYKSLGEELVLNSNGGAIAFWGSTTMTAPTSQMNLATSFYNLLNNKTRNGVKEVRMGDVILEAKSSQGAGQMNKDTVQSWTLIGDPAIKLPEQSFTATSSAVFDNAPSVSPAAAAGGGCSLFADDGSKKNDLYGLLEYLILFIMFYCFRRLFRIVLK